VSNPTRRLAKPHREKEVLALKPTDLLFQETWEKPEWVGVRRKYKQKLLEEQKKIWERSFLG
jgi:hypothetical protein